MASERFNDPGSKEAEELVVTCVSMLLLLGALVVLFLVMREHQGALPYVKEMSQKHIAPKVASVDLSGRVAPGHGR